MFRVLVCGGRDFADIENKLGGSIQHKKAQEEYKFLFETLSDQLFDMWEYYLGGPKSYGDVVIIHGDAKGADRAAGLWASSVGAGVWPFPADWKTHGKAAGPIRNKQMLDEGEPDLVIAFPGGAGTANMVKQAKDRGIEVREIKYVSGS